ncbi:MAG TPA: protein kinase [Steroidobacter sp.]
MTLLTDGTILASRYRVRGHLGEGGMSDVYRVEALHQPGAWFAAKVLKHEVQQLLWSRFQDEARILAGLKHPGIVQFHGGYESRGRLFYVLEYVEGVSLPERLSQGPLEVPEALRLMKGVLEALDYAHQKGVVHRDVKPSNILIDKAGRPLLCDFGVARQLGKERRTRYGTTLGTPHYMSPEQIQPPYEVDFRSDLYSAGIVLYEMLAGRAPFGHEPASDSDIQQQHVNKQPPDPRNFNRQLDSGLVEILKKALQKKPSDRYQGGTAFKQALEQYESATKHREPRSDVAQYEIYKHPHSQETIVVKKGISIPGLVLGPIWLLINELFVAGALAFIGSSILLVVVSGPLMSLAFGIAWGIPPALLNNSLLAKRCRQRGYELIETTSQK